MFYRCYATLRSVAYGRSNIKTCLKHRFFSFHTFGSVSIKYICNKCKALQNTANSNKHANKSA